MPQCCTEANVYTVCNKTEGHSEPEKFCYKHGDHSKATCQKCLDVAEFVKSEAA